MTELAARRRPARGARVIVFGAVAMSTELEGDVHTIRLVGELDGANTDGVQLELRRLQASGAGAIVIDLSGLTSIDSAGVRLLLSARTRSRSGANRLTLLRGPDAVQRVLELSDVADLLPFAE